MDKRIIYEIKLYCNPYSLLIINKYGKLKRIYCPFSVKVVMSFNTFQRNEIVIVQQVQISKDYKLLYVINNNAYRSSLFIII